MAATAGAASFDSTPPTDNQSGAGPFNFAARSGGGDGENGWLAYKLPTEPGWHRCQHPNPVQFSMSNLPDGKYTVQIADDINKDYWAARGQLYSGHTTGCDTTDPPSTSITSYTFTVNSQPTQEPPQEQPPPESSPPEGSPPSDPDPQPEPTSDSRCPRRYNALLTARHRYAAAKAKYRRHPTTKNRRARTAARRARDRAASRYYALSCYS